MRHKSFPPWRGLSSRGVARPLGSTSAAPPSAGAVQRGWPPLSRRQFLRVGACTGLVLGAGLCLPKRADANGCDDLLPNPVPFSQRLAGFGPFHFYRPGPVDQPGVFRPGPHEPSLITDFNGFIGVAVFDGAATDGSSNTFGGEIRFMKGVYVGVDEKLHQGAFALI